MKDSLEFLTNVQHNAKQNLQFEDAYVFKVCHVIGCSLQSDRCLTQRPWRQGVFGWRFRTLQFIVARDMLDSSGGQSTEKDALCLWVSSYLSHLGP